MERRSDELLAELDSTLNIFALANGLGLLKNEGGVPDRIFEWYRDGMERRMGLRMDGTDAVTVWVEAVKKRDGITRRARRTLRDRMERGPLGEELRTILAEGIERANGLSEDELDTSGEGAGASDGR